MLSHLIVRNFAIIDRLEFDFHEGMTVITGETGAGKSIIVDALNLVLGGRGSDELIRTDADKAIVEAIFELSPQRRLALAPMLEERGIECDAELIVRRILNRSGRNKVFINGCATRLTTLREIAAGLVDISGQHEHYSLLEARGHVTLLDAFAGLERDAERVLCAVGQLRALRREVERLQSGERERVARMDYLEFQLGEIREASLSIDEERQIEQEIGLLRNVERLKETAAGAIYHLDDAEGAISDTLAGVCARVQRVAQLDPRLNEIACMLEEAQIQVGEAARELRSYAEDIESQPGRLNALEDRWVLIERLKRKHGATIVEILEVTGAMASELALLRKAESRISEATREMIDLRKSVMAQARTLSQRRKRAAKRLRTLVEDELAPLGMARCRFAVTFSYRDASGQPTDDVNQASPNSLTDNGIDEIEFLISPNLGESLKPMSKIASGELSRIMLAIKNALMLTDPVETYVFDEVDTGIGGGIAEVVGRKIKEVAKNHQVFCITHLPQIASFADHHVVVSKREVKGRTVSALNTLGQKERTSEIARMLGGEIITKKTLEHAEEMIAKANSPC